ncbi:uncharacterized protein LOC135215545 isoform X2 [Macrobrachium nipponense]|uniref:uncharacterized protein LOC135215545 isoform X2 n=1 Tax=Macrobrachium nipponense TaxID=159736 RepID=UPI0030C88B2D
MRRGRGLIRGGPRSDYKTKRKIPSSKPPRKTPERDPCALFVSFGETINQDVAKEIMEFATTAEDISFGLKCHLKFDSEEKALEMESTAAEVEFTDNKAAVIMLLENTLKKQKSGH